MQTYYLHHAGGLPCVPRNLRLSASGPDSAVTPLRFATGGTTIEEFARNAIADLVARDTPRVPGARVLYGHSMGGLVAHEMCRQLGAELAGHVDVIVLAATAPWWLPGLERPQAACAFKREGSNRLQTHLAAIDRYRPRSPVVPGVPIRVLYAAGDPVVPPAAVRRWASFGWKEIGFHNMDSASHLFHTETADESFALRWKAFAEGFESATN